MVHDRKSSEIQRTLAANLRRMRIARHISLSGLAREMGVSKATLSGIENGRSNPTVETLAGLAQALRSSIAELLEEPSLGEIRVVRSARGEQGDRDGMPRRVLGAIPAGGGVEIAELVLAAHERREAPAGTSGARAHLYVRAGRLIAGPVERHTELAAGDYASFPADVPQVYEAARSPARALLLTVLSD
jgi:transcriptional regulator with XRE-family HTH domain